jgi:hypothetical protein
VATSYSLDRAVAPESALNSAVGRTIFSVVHSFGAPGDADKEYDAAARFTVAQVERMPGYMRLGIKALLGCLYASTLPSRGRPFHRLPARDRLAILRGWESSRIGLKRDLIRLIKTLSTLRLLSGPEPSPIATFNVRRGTSPECVRSEICVIGSGPGGAVTASTLAKAGREVLVLEEGPDLPLDSCEPFSLAEMSQKYRSGGLTAALGRVKIPYVEGRCVGGGSEINSGLYHRTPPEILTRWRQEFELRESDAESLRAHFEFLERELPVTQASGPFPLSSMKLSDGAAQLGWKSLAVPRFHGEAGRRSMSKTLLPEAIRHGCRLHSETQVTRIARRGSRWEISARQVTGGGVRKVTYESDHVFISAGAIQTPALLLRSGLSRLAGNSLQLHPTAKIAAVFDETVNFQGAGVPVHQVKEFSPLLSFGCSISSRPYLGLSLLDYPSSENLARDQWERMAIYYAMISPQGCGSVRLLPGFDSPLVRYSLAKTDLIALEDGIRKLGTLLLEAGATSLFPSGPGNLMTVHLFSSCPMGEDRKKCVVDSFGKVHGQENLYVADASILCSAPGVNPQGSIMAFARRNALAFLD